MGISIIIVININNTSILIHLTCLYLTEQNFSKNSTTVLVKFSRHWAMEHFNFFFKHFGDNADSKVTSMKGARKCLWLAKIKVFLLKAFDHKETYCYVTLDDHCLDIYIHYLDAGIFLKTSLLFRRLKKKTHDKTWRKRSLLQFASLKPSWCLEPDRILRKQTCFLRGSLSPWWRNSEVTGFQRTPAEVKHTGTPLCDHTFSSRRIPQQFVVAWNIEQCEMTVFLFLFSAGASE